MLSTIDPHLTLIFVIFPLFASTSLKSDPPFPPYLGENHVVGKLGTALGTKEGDADGPEEGDADGPEEGNELGTVVGTEEGDADGDELGTVVGAKEGAEVGSSEKNAPI